MLFDDFFQSKGKNIVNDAEKERYTQGNADNQQSVLFYLFFGRPSDLFKLVFGVLDVLD